MSEMDLNRFKFIDESGVNLAMTRLYGRAPRGERVNWQCPYKLRIESHDPWQPWAQAGLGALMTVDGATDGVVFRFYVGEVLCPTLRRGDIVVMDNLSAHKVSGIREAIEGRGAKLIYLPPYSPDLSPIEKCWSKIKSELRAIGARTRRSA